MAIEGKTTAEEFCSEPNLISALLIVLHPTRVQN